MEVDSTGAESALKDEPNDKALGDTEEHPENPDAQAAITDFLDYTEYLPSDVARSFTLIEALEEQHAQARAAFKELTAVYTGMSDKPVPRETTDIKASISEKLKRAIDTRAKAKAEAERVAVNVVRHQQKLVQIQAKLQGLYDSFPTEQEEQAATTRATVSAQATKIPKVTLKVGDSKVHRGSRVKKGPRITVPGEVLAPNEFDWDSFDSDYDIPTPESDPIRPGSKKIKFTVRKSGDDKVLKTPRARAPGVMGTNVHSAVAGISTSNALAKLQPAPADAPVGGPHKPWGRLTLFELAKLRKRMKKNAVWVPSSTMVNRELESVGRTFKNFQKAKAEAEAAGKEYEYPWNPPDSYLHDRQQIKELEEAAKEDAQAAAAAAGGQSAAKNTGDDQIDPVQKIVDDAARVMRDMLEPGKANGSVGTPSAGSLKPPAKAGASKRKLSPASEADSKAEERPAKKQAIVPATPLPTGSQKSMGAILPNMKGQVRVTPVPPPRSARGRITLTQSALNRAKDEMSPVAEASTPSTLSAAASIETPDALQPSPPRKATTPILPPTRAKRGIKTDEKPPILPQATPVAPPTRTLRLRTSKTPDPSLQAQMEGAMAAKPPITLTLPSRRPGSRSGKAQSVEPVVSSAKDRPHRTSTTRTTPVPEPPATPAPRAVGGRKKRPPPGQVTPSQDGSVSITIGKRSAAPRKKAGGKKGATGKNLPAIEEDENGLDIDPNEPRYCLCNGVSFGEMIACENSHVSLLISSMKQKLTTLVPLRVVPPRLRRPHTSHPAQAHPEMVLPRMHHNARICSKRGRNDRQRKEEVSCFSGLGVQAEEASGMEWLCI